MFPETANVDRYLSISVLVCVQQTFMGQQVILHLGKFMFIFHSEQLINILKMISSVSVYSRHSSESSFILSTGTSAETDDESNYGL